MIYIVDDIGKVVESLQETVLNADEPGAGAPYYMYGHRLEIANRLTQKGQDKIFQYQKYPLIALRLDTVEKKIGESTLFSLNLIIVTSTMKQYNAEERYLNVFKPILYPLYKRFINALRQSGTFSWPGNQYQPEHTKIDRPFWGTQTLEKNEKYIFNDPLDAIEILDLKLYRFENEC